MITSGDMIRRSVGVLGLSFLSLTTLAAESPPVDFDRDVRPIRASACFKCHGEAKQQGGLRFDRSGKFVGDSGSLAIVPGKAGQSELILRLESSDATLRMPQEAAPLLPEQIKTMRA